MPELPTTPFPELHALDQTRTLPSLAELLGASASLPSPPPSRPRPEIPGALRLPAFPDPVGNPALSAPCPRPASPPLDDLPLTDSEETIRETLAALMAEDFDGPVPIPKPLPSHPAGAGPTPASVSAPAPAGLSPPEMPTPDRDLSRALRPLIESAVGDTVSRTEASLQQFLEPMLRSTVRRAIAEQMESSRQFKRIGAFDRLGLRLRSLLTGRSYEDIIFNRTRRYQVEEVFLLRREGRSLVSYASHDPARHVSLRRVQGTVRILKSKLQGPEGSLESTFDLPERRLVLVREGQFTLLLAILRGRSNALVRADLDYVLRQIEDRFGERLDQKSEAFLTVLQPLLEGCLLIRSPSPPD